jgi:hypothetical protein
MWNYLGIFVILLSPGHFFAQDSLSQTSAPDLNTEKEELRRLWQFSGYIETYYLFDFNTPEDHNRLDFVYSHNRHNEFNLNLGFIKTAVKT